MRDLRVRAAFAAGVAASLLLLGAGLWLRHIVYAERMRAAEQEARTMVLSLQDTIVGNPSLDKDDLNVFVTFSLGESSVPESDTVAYLLVSADGTVRRGSEELEPYVADRTLLPAPPTGRVVDYRPQDSSVRLGAPPPGARGRLAHRTYPVLYADTDLDTPWDLTQLGLRAKPLYTPPIRLYVMVLPFEAERAVARVDRLLAPGVPVAVVLVALVAWLATDRALRPVERMRAQTAEFSARGLDRRLSVPDSDDRLARLAVTFNDTLDRLAASAQRQRRFIADAAHELRTPIGSVRAILEVAAAHPDPADQAAVIQEAATEARRLHRLAEDLLLLARLEAAVAVPREPVDLAALARDQVADRGRAGPIRVSCDVTGPAIVAGDRAQLDRLLRNLLDNAERHARGAVTVTVGPDPAAETVRVTVADDGPGIAAADRRRVLLPFTRLDDARARDAGGSGLGLAIARDICAGHGGSLEVVESDLGGAGLLVRLPSAG
ncbi:HAMP domain-containing sensor histidine kinase [Actinoplanes sp. NPDC051475]|uniref:sensor histidine kinase n=1 Tax=Actinoplanes sp. NPDC051475 TaxID=3157225 RepID=UPI00344E2FD3